MRGDELTGEWRKIHNEELNDLCSSPSIVHVIKSGKMRWRGMQHIWGSVEVYTGFWWGNVRERDRFEDPGIEGKILRRIFRKWDVGVWTGLIWLRIGTGGRHL